MDCLEHPPPVQQIPPGIPPGGRVTSPIPAVQGVTDYGTIGYTGPCPPHGQMIRYLFKVYGLNTMLDLAAGSNKHELITAMKGHVIQFGETAAIWTIRSPRRAPFALLLHSAGCYGGMLLNHENDAKFAKKIMTPVRIFIGSECIACGMAYMMNTM